MLHNPWRGPVGDYDGPPLNESGLGPELQSLVRRKFGDDPETGFGYGSSTVLGKNSILKIAPYPFHRDRFDHERAVSGLSLPGIDVPSILDEGVTSDYEWIEISRVPGHPAYEVWSDLSTSRQLAFTEHLADCVSALQAFQPKTDFLHAKFDSWQQHVLHAVERSIHRAADVTPAEVIEQAREFVAENGKHLHELPRVLCHGDLWFGNILADEQGKLTAIIDWDRLAVAPPDYELDMTWRFWRYPWDFVSEQFESQFQSELDPSLLRALANVSSKGISFEILNARLSMLELAYRLGITARFGWSTKHARMLDAVLSGDWARRLAALCA